MLYREYKQRLEKYKNAIEKVWRFRYLVLLAFVLLVALIGVLIGITGNVYDVTCPAEIVYGSDYNIEGKAVFRKATVEYRMKGASDWSEEKPIRVGAYEVRVVSKGVAGKKKVWGPASFNLIPKKADVTVLGDSFAYGESPEVTAPLAYQDRFTGVRLEYEWGEERVCKVTPSVEKIVNKNGYDVTECYTLFLNAKDMNVIPRPITVQTDSATKVYDGTPLKAESYSLTGGTLLDGETLQVDFPSLQIDAAECQNIPVCTVLDKNGKDISSRYDVSVLAGTLKVLQREIQLKTGSKTWIYDEKPHSFSSEDAYEIKGLLKGHSAQVAQAVTLTDVTDTKEEVGYRDNVLEMRISDESGKDVTKNYKITHECGRLRIKSRIRIWVFRLMKIYDGTPLRFEQGDYYIDEQPPDVTVSLDLSKLSVTDVGFLPLSEAYDVPIRVDDIKTGTDVRKYNYWEFLGEANEPILKVEKRKIEVRSISITKVRGDSPLMGQDTAWISLGTLVNGHSIKIEVTGVLNVDEASADNVISSVKIFDALNKEITHNYEISSIPGVLRWDENPPTE